MKTDHFANAQANLSLPWCKCHIATSTLHFFPYGYLNRFKFPFRFCKQPSDLAHLDKSKIYDTVEVIGHR